MKKIFDIIPPKKNNLNNSLFKQKEEFFKREKKNISFPKKKAIFLLFAFVFSGIFVHFAFSKAEIKIWPETKSLSFEDEVAVNSQITNLDFSSSTIPGKIIEEEKEINQQFPATGSVSKKARGIIQIYNAYSTSSQVLVATTRFVSASGKLFRTPKKVRIPGGHYERGKLVPGQIDIEVIADQPGEDYNIEPTTFSIPGFAGHAKFTFFYAKSFSPMTGGGTVAQITEKDLENAEKVLLDSLKRVAKDSLLMKAEEKFILLDKTLKQEVQESSSSIEAGREAENFNYKVRIKSKALVFKEQNLKDFAKSYITSQIEEDKKLYEESVELNYFAKKIDLESGKINLFLEFSCKIYPDIDVLSFKRALSNKLLNEAKILLENQSGITSFQIELYPFWLKKVPENIDKINIEIKLD
ncbi:hypothetical protein KAU51_01595 [Candidatus Parcubacteria bacterium]|nr:hypothetical protein [Candidatus Parcubacteria bacterium]